MNRAAIVVHETNDQADPGGAVAVDIKHGKVPEVRKENHKWDWKRNWALNSLVRSGLY